MIELFLAHLQRFFKPPPSPDLGEKSRSLAMTLGTLAAKHRESEACWWRALCVVEVLQCVATR
jgi:hypothetical protein